MGRRELKDLAEPEHVYQLLIPGLPADFPPLRSLEAATHNFPAQPTSFIGRAAEIKEICGLLAEARCVTLTGIGGTGKTRLALEVGRECLDTYSDGVWFVDLSPITDDSLVHREVASVLGVEEEVLDDSLCDKNMLLLLDNCEHLLDTCGRALTLQHESLVEFKEAGGPGSIFWAVAFSRFGMRTLGDVGWVLELYGAIWDTPDEVAAKCALAASLYSLGRLAGQHGDLARASAMLNDSLTLHSEIGFKRGVELALLETASVARARGEPPRAALLLGAAESAARATAPTLTDYERREFERARAEIEAGLDGETFARLRDEGEAMSIDAAVAFAPDA